MVETRTKERSHGETDVKTKYAKAGRRNGSGFVVTHQNLRRVQQERVP
tara:strand:- start:212 stop:355 length:144 start_codon:yes stop_codon:yes gene_type:complete